MVGSRTATAVAGLAVSVLVSAALWWYFDSLVFLLFLPFVPFLFRRSDTESSVQIRECPDCGFRTTDDSHQYCPRDGRRLE